MSPKSAQEKRKGKVAPLVPAPIGDPWTGTPLTGQPQLDLDLPAEPTPDPTGIDHPDGGKIPTWIENQLHENGTRQRAKRKAQFHYCKNCSAIVLTGLDSDICAWLATTDPTPLTPAEETATLLAGRTTYTANIDAHTITLDRRHQDHMPRHPNTPAVPKHQCGARFASFITPPREDHPHDIPF